MSLTMLRMEFRIVLLTVSICSSSRQWRHLVRSHLLTQASQPRTCLQHVDILTVTLSTHNTSYNKMLLLMASLVEKFWKCFDQEWLFCPEAFWFPGFLHYPHCLSWLRFHNLQWQKSSLHLIARKVYLQIKI